MKKKKNRLKLIRFFMLVLTLSCMGYGIYNYFFDKDIYALSVEIPDLTSEPEIITYNEPISEPEIINITYNISKIKKAVIAEFKLYFTIDNYTDFTLINEGNWDDSYYSDEDKDINVGTGSIENNSNKYEMILAHEYFHYALHRMNLTNGNVHEALADVYTRYTHKQASIELWGIDNSGRDYPYNIITNDVIINGESCLNNVFDKTNKMSGVEELLNRLELYCDIQLIDVINEI